MNESFIIIMEILEVLLLDSEDGQTDRVVKGPTSHADLEETYFKARLGVQFSPEGHIRVTHLLAAFLLLSRFLIRLLVKVKRSWIHGVQALRPLAVNGTDLLFAA